MGTVKKPIEQRLLNLLANVLFGLATLVVLAHGIPSGYSTGSTALDLAVTEFVSHIPVQYAGMLDALVPQRYQPILVVAGFWGTIMSVVISATISVFASPEQGRTICWAEAARPKNA